MREIFLFAALFAGLATFAQNTTDLVEIVRSDIRTENRAIVLANLGLTEEQSKAFNPIYDQYQSAMKAHWDKRIQLIKDYAERYTTMDDATAKSMLTRLNTLEKESLSIRNSYEKKLMKVLPATVVTRWAQIESRLSKLIDLQIAEEIPLMPTKR
jgi:adenylate kinase family enzyme